MGSVPSKPKSMLPVTVEQEHLLRIRPSWQGRNLIERVRLLLPVDPSSACQRLFNAAIHDLREKVVVAGLDIAQDAAKQHRLPPITSQEDVEEYRTSRLIELAFRMGLLTYAERRKLQRCYEIRRDLEHEDDTYQAGIEDCVYMFMTCVDVVLARDPVHPVRVQEVKNLIEQPSAAVPSQELLADFQQAPEPRQVEILGFLVATALDEGQSDRVRGNAFSFLSPLASLALNSALLTIANSIQSKLTGKGVTLLRMRVAHAVGALPYQKQAHLRTYFSTVLKRLEETGHHWREFEKHGLLLQELKDVGGLKHCPQPIRQEILRWLVKAYIGEEGGVTRFGNVRYVFYSDTAAPYVVELIRDAARIVRDDLRELAHQDDIRELCHNQYLERRLDSLLDIVDTAE